MDKGKAEVYAWLVKVGIDTLSQLVHVTLRLIVVVTAVYVFLRFAHSMLEKPTVEVAAVQAAMLIVAAVFKGVFTRKS